MKGRSGRKTGGTVVKNSPVTTAYSGGDSNVAKEARAARKKGGKVMGEKAKMNMGRAPRKSGGICSADWTAAQGPGTSPPGRVTDGSLS